VGWCDETSLPRRDLHHVVDASSAGIQGRVEVLERGTAARLPGPPYINLSLCLLSSITNIMGKFSEAFKHTSEKTPAEPPPSFQEATTPYKTQFSAGSSSSNQPPTFACLLLSATDRIRTVNFPEHTLGPIEEAIKRVWAPGIQSQSYKTPGNYEWKLSGRPCTLRAESGSVLS